VSSRDEIVYALGLIRMGVACGYGKQRRLLVIDGRGVYAQLAKSDRRRLPGYRGRARKGVPVHSESGKCFAGA